jgi:hypothetical protein
LCPNISFYHLAVVVGLLGLLPVGVLDVADSATNNAPASQPSPEATRPLLLAGTQEALRAHILENSANDWRKLRDEFPRRLADLRGEGLPDLLMSAALLAVVEPGGGYLQSADGLLNTALDNLAADPDPELAMYVALALNWLLPMLTEAEQAASARSASEVLAALSSSSGTAPERPPQEAAKRGAVLLLSRSIMLRPDSVRAGSLYQQSVAEWLNTLLPRLQSESGDDGGLPGGVGETLLACEASTYALALLAETGPADLLDRYPFVRDGLVYYRYALLGDGPGVLPYDEMPGGDGTQALRRLQRFLPLLAARRADRFLQAEALKLKPTDPLRWWPYFIWSDPSLTPEQSARWPAAHYFEHLGIVAARTGWGPDATVLGFRVTPQSLPRQRNDMGAMLLFRRRWALPMTATGAEPDRPTDYNRIVSSQPGAPALILDQPTPVGDRLPQVPPTSIPAVTAFETNAYYTYVAADLTHAFAGTYSSVVRHVLLVGDPTGKADVVVTCDIVDPGDGNRRPGLIYHWTERPTWSVTDGVFSVTDGPARTFCCTPAPPSGVPTTVAVPAPRGVEGLPSTLYRTELQAKFPSTVEAFINVFCMTDSSFEEMPIRPDWILGSRTEFEVQVDWDVMTCLVGFNADGSPGGTIYFEDATRNEPLFRRPLAAGVEAQKSANLFSPPAESGGPAPAASLPPRPWPETP